jgi:hypothetical protein
VTNAQRRASLEYQLLAAGLILKHKFTTFAVFESEQQLTRWLTLKELQCWLDSRQRKQGRPTASGR